MGSDFRFGAFEVDLRAHELRKKGLRVRLAEQPFQVLAILLEHPGEVVTRDELRRRLWPADTFVDFGHSLNNAVNRLRSALGDQVGTPLLIETLPRHGYRFIGPVERLQRQNAPPHTTPQRTPRLHVTGWRRLVAAGAVLALLAVVGYFARIRVGRPQPAARVAMLAVLPFENLTGDPEQEYLCDGLTEEMITQIATLQPQQLGVIARTSSMHYKATRKPLEEVARELGVDYVLEGSVRRSASRLRINAQLIRVRDRTHLWAESFDRDATDVLDVERHVARAVAREIQLVLPSRQQARLRRGPAANPEAHQLYIKGLYLANKGLEPSLTRALVQFERAISKDPRFAPAYAGKAVCYTRLSTFYMPPTEAMPLAREAALKALELDADLSEAHTALGVVKLFFDWDHSGAEAELVQAIALNPSSADAHAWYGYLLGSLGRHEEALEKTRRALALDPLSAVRHADLQWQLLLARRYDEVVEEGRKALELEPHMALAHLNTGTAYSLKGDLDRAVAELEDAVRLDESSMMMLGLAYAYAVSGKTREARELLDEMSALSERRYVCAFEMGVAQGALGDTDRAFEWLRRAIDERSDCIPWLNVEPMLDTLRDDPRFAALVRQVGFRP
jgi:TolB-like protein/DNA-binding winged helix-turn-helix (wHTH) protein/Tfp pilus assembly protein PilF